MKLSRAKAVVVGVALVGGSVVMTPHVASAAEPEQSCNLANSSTFLTPSSHPGAHKVTFTVAAQMPATDTCDQYGSISGTVSTVRRVNRAVCHEDGSLTVPRAKGSLKIKWADKTTSVLRVSVSTPGLFHDIEIQGHVTGGTRFVGDRVRAAIPYDDLAECQGWIVHKDIPHFKVQQLRFYAPA